MKTVFMNVAVLILSMVAFSANTPAPMVRTVADDLLLLESALGGAHLVFAGKHGGNITKSELRGQTELQVDGCARGSRIFTYSLQINSQGNSRTLPSNSNVLTKEMITALEGLRAGDSFQFKSIKAYLPNGRDVVDVTCNKFVVV